MLKRALIFCILLLIIFTFSSLGWAGILMRGSAGAPSCASCNSGTDSRIVDNGNDADSDYASTYYRAVRFSVGAGGICLTGFFINAGDGGSGYDLTCWVYSDDGTSDCDGSLGCPDASLGASYSATYSNLPDSRTDIEILLASTQSLSEGTYHFVCHGGGDSITYGRDTGASNTDTNYSSDAENWAASSGELEFGGMGCNPS